MNRRNDAITVEQPLSAMRAEADYLFALVRQFRSAHPAIAALGRRMHDARGRRQ